MLTTLAMGGFFGCFSLFWITIAVLLGLLSFAFLYGGSSDGEKGFGAAMAAISFAMIVALAVVRLL